LPFTDFILPSTGKAEKKKPADKNVRATIKCLVIEILQVG